MLDHLPVEILDFIFAEVAEFDPAYLPRATFHHLALTCHTLHHIACRWLYREVKFEHDSDHTHYGNGFLGFGRFLCFLRAIEASEKRGFSYPYHTQAYGIFVRHLSVTIDLQMRELVDTHKTVDCRDPKPVMERLLGRIPNVQTLIIYAWTEGEREEVRLGNRHRFQHLTDLRITTDGMTLPLWIFESPNLRRVSVDSAHIFKAGTWTRLPSSVTSFWLAHPPRQGATVNDVFISPDRLETFGYVESFGPYSLHGDLDSIITVMSFLHPIHGTLKRLNLDSCEAPDTEMNPPVLVDLSVFSALEYLSLSGSWLPNIIQELLCFPPSLRELHFLCGRIPVPHTKIRHDGPMDAQHGIDAVLKFISLKTQGILPSLKVITFTESLPLPHFRHVVVDSNIPSLLKRALRRAGLRFVCRFMVPGCLPRRVPDPLDDCCPRCQMNRNHWLEDDIAKGRIVDFPTQLTTSLAWPPSEW